MVSVAASADGAGGSVPATSLQSEGVSLWRGDLDVSALPGGSYTLTVVATYEDGLRATAIACAAFVSAMSRV